MSTPSRPFETPLFMSYLRLETAKEDRFGLGFAPKWPMMLMLSSLGSSSCRWCVSVEKSTMATASLSTDSPLINECSRGSVRNLLYKDEEREAAHTARELYNMHT